MSHAPTVFISAATIDLLHLRDLLANAFKAAQFRVLVQNESLGAPLGNLRDLLVDAISQSDCVIHLAGTGYGSHATEAFPEAPAFRCSWTQFEYYHAHLTGVPAIAFTCGPKLSQFKDGEQEDPAEPGLKATLQKEHQERISSGEFDGTPCAGRKRTINAAAASNLYDVTIRVAEAIAALQRKHHTTLPAEAVQQVERNLQGIRLLHTLPPPPRGFTGREKELEELRKTTGQAGAVITGLRGMGGIGKTALALVLAHEWAPRFPDAALLLDGKGLAGDAAPSAAKLMEQVILAFHPEAKLPDDFNALSGIYQNVLHGKNALILLDNAKDAQQAKPLLPPDGCALIVTSRAGFTIDGVAPYTVGRMDDAEAEKLLRNAYDKLTADEVKQLLRLCAGLPLALKLAAAHLALDAADHHGTANVARYLQNLGGGRLANLDADAEDAAEITISETLRLSVEPLPEPERHAWEKLAIFTTHFDALAAEEIAGADEQMLDHFLRRSLLESAAPGRYQLHDLAADYARTRLSAAEIDALALALARHYQTVAEAANQLYMEGEVLAGLALFDRERAQIEAAFAAMVARPDEAAAERVIGIVEAIVYVGQSLRFHPRQRIVLLESQLRAARHTGRRNAEGTALGNLGNAHAALGDARKAIEYYMQSLELYRELGDRRGEGSVLGNLGIAYKNLGDAQKAIGYHEQCLEIAREVGNRRGEGTALANLGNAHFSLGDARKAIGCYEQRLEIARDIGDRRGEGNALGNLGAAQFSLGDARQAIGYYEQQLEIARKIGDLGGEGNSLGNRGIAHFNSGDARKAIEYYEQQKEIAREIGDRRGEGKSLWNSALAYDSLGERAEAVKRAEAALAVYESIEDPNAAKVRKNLALWKSQSAGGL